MMPLVRRTSLVVVVLLLASVATACAECAWVLWERVSDPRFGGDGVYWDIIRTYDDYAGCSADFKKLMSPNSAWHAAYEPFMEDSVIMRRPNGVSIVKRALCMPGTIDPRGPR